MIVGAVANLEALRGLEVLSGLSGSWKCEFSCKGRPLPVIRIVMTPLVRVMTQVICTKPFMGAIIPFITSRSPILWRTSQDIHD